RLNTALPRLIKVKTRPAPPRAPERDRMRTVSPLAWLFLTASMNPARAGDAWPQFRGPNGTGRAASDAPLPAQIGPETNVLWKADVPPGHSSPVVFGDRVYLTAAR